MTELDAVSRDIARIDAWMTIPANRVSARLRGEAFLLNDSAMCVRERFNVRTMKPEPPTRKEEVECRRKESLAALLIEAAELIEAAQGPSQ